MPLRSRITNPAFAAKAEMSTSTEIQLPQNLEDFNDPEDVWFTSTYGVRIIELNRPTKLNALNASMIHKIIPRLQEWAKSDMVNAVIMKGAGERAFCAGGDVATLAQWNSTGPEGQALSTSYFGLEYQLDHLIATYKKPYIAFMDGITMGGGVGLSMHAPLRIATERTIFAMPETAIGFFPDVGASFFLPRLPGAIGTYLALTSERLSGVNVFYTGLATHYIHSTTLPLIEARLAELRFKDYYDLKERLTIINSTIEEYISGLPDDQPILLGGQLREVIDRCFSPKNIKDIIRELEMEAEREGGLKEWAEKTLEILQQRSPTSVITTLKQMQLGKEWSIREAFFREYHMAARFMRHPDFIEGVSSILTKPRRSPEWQPASLEDIPPDSDIADKFFLKDKSVPEFELLDKTSESGDWKEYPWNKFGIPSEQEVEKVWKMDPSERGDKERFHRKTKDKPKDLEKKSRSLPLLEIEKKRDAVLAWFMEMRRAKQGVKEVVEEIIYRRAEVWEAEEQG